MHQNSYQITEEIVETSQGYQIIGGFWQLKKIKIIIQHSSKNELIYLQDGEILKKEKKTDNLEIIKNIEMIKYAKWDGESNNDNMKCGNWQAFWKGKKLGVGGYYNKSNLKTGKWLEFFNQYWDRCQVILKGEYKNGKKFGIWEMQYRQQQREQFQIMQFKLIYLKQYKEVYALMTKTDSNKEGHLKYLNNFGILEFGEYRDGKKVGKWDILSKQSIILAGGNYNQKGLKDGRWVELEQHFWIQNQVIQIGDYQNGIKVGFWKIQFKMTELFDYQDIGGGLYINNKKTGRWKEIHDNFHNQCQVIYAGEYFNGVKIGQWNTQYKGIRQDEFNIIGGGLYFNGRKIKQWVDLHPNFENQRQVIQTGVYDEGLKQGQWKILFRTNHQENYQNMQTINQNQRGTGFYENGCQIGKSCELHQIYFNKYQIFWSGEYTKGYKNGWWDIIWKNKSNDSQEKIIGGGSYLNGIKNGQWTDLVDKFSSQSWQEKVIVGEYVNGEKSGVFIIQQII
ncbi:unnamed protein product [Paramecium octaurelia]|uniref:Uncharacterized protein n=1 Tax=Paramecium octaurelia TaxID=43137 RepID=A0A8S1TVC5_PAROT|nr:unnamed protein product [Paramecium octaurelia]